MGTGPVSETLVSFNHLTRLPAWDLTEFSRRQSFKTQNINLLAYDVFFNTVTNAQEEQTASVFTLEDVENVVILKRSLLTDLPLSS
jgi:hypothetical protein